MGEAARIRVLGVDDHPLMREGVAAIVRGDPGLKLVGQAGDGREAILRFRELLPDVTLMDVRLPDMSGIEAVAALRAEFPKARFLMLSSFEGDVEVQRALAAGAAGYLLKTAPPEEIVRAIRTVFAGGKCVPATLAADVVAHLGEESLTDREVGVLREVARGLRNREIARELGVAEETVKVHVRNLLGKLGARDRTEAVAIAIRRGVIHY